MVSVAFECINAKVKDQFVENFIRAANGTIQKKQFVLTILQHEFETVQQIKSLILEYDFPATDTDIEQSYFYSRFINAPEEFDEFIKYVDRVSPQRKLFKRYERIFDKLSKEGVEWYMKSITRTAK
mgnify:CR=1 FL=1